MDSGGNANACRRVQHSGWQSFLISKNYSLITTQWGVGNWKAILKDPKFKFDNRSPVDLKDR